MAGLREHRLNRVSIDKPAANSNTQIEFPADRGLIHEAIGKFSLGANAMTEDQIIQYVPQYTLNLNGEDYCIYKTDDIFMLDRYYGESFNDGELPTRYSQEIRRTIGEVEATAFVPSAFVSPYIMYEFSDTLPDTATMKQMLVSEGIGQKNRNKIASAQNPAAASNMVIKHYRKSLNVLVSGNGNENIFELEARADKVRALHFKAANITEIKIKVDEQERLHFESLADLNARLAAKGLVPQDDVWHIDFEALGGSIDAMFDQNYGNRPNKMTFEITTSDTTDIELLAELYNKPRV